MTIKPPMSFEAFFTKEGSCLKEFAFLFGNGLIISYPDSAPLYADVRDSITIDTQKVWEASKERIQEAFEGGGNNIEVENFLNYIRRVYSFCAFDQWIKRQKKLNSTNLCKPRDFLKHFKAIYTLNYDYLTCVSMFGGDGNNYSIKDGFDGSSPIELKDIEDRLENNICQSIELPFLYLHGAFHIFQREDGKYYKVKSSNGSFFENIQSAYDKISKDINHLLDQNSKAHDNPIIVFSGKSRNKLAMIKSNSYLAYCLKKLSEEKKVFTFGCSFKLDTHILDAILKPLKGEGKEVYLGWYSEEDKKTIEQCLKNKASNIDVTVTLVGLSDTQRSFIHQKVWGVNTPDHQQ